MPTLGILSQHREKLYLAILGMYTLLTSWPLFFASFKIESYSAPLLPFLYQIFLALGVSDGAAVKAVLLPLYFLSFFTFYFFVRVLFRSINFAFISSLIYALPPFLLYLIFPSLRVTFSALYPIQSAFLVFGKGDHVASLALMPLAFVFFVAFLRSGDSKIFFWASFLGAATAMISSSAYLGFLIFSLALIYAEALVERGRIKFGRAAFLHLVIFLLCLFWYTPEVVWGTLVSLLHTGVLRNLVDLIPVSFVIGPPLLTLSYLYASERYSRAPLVLIFTLIFIFLGIILFPWEFWNKAFVSDPFSLILEAKIATSLLGAYLTFIGVSLLQEKYPRWGGFPWFLLAIYFFGMGVFASLENFALLRESAAIGEISLRGYFLGRARTLGYYLGAGVSLATVIFLSTLYTNKPLYILGKITAPLRKKEPAPPEAGQGGAKKYPPTHGEHRV